MIMAVTWAAASRTVSSTQPQTGSDLLLAGRDRYRRVMVWPSGWWLVAAAAGVALVSQGAGELVAQLVAFLPKFADLVVGSFQTLPQRGVGGTLAGRCDTRSHVVSELAAP